MYFFFFFGATFYVTIQNAHAMFVIVFSQYTVNNTNKTHLLILITFFSPRYLHIQ